MKNIEMRVEGNKLILTIDLTKEFGLTSSEKSIAVASTGASVVIPYGQGYKLGLNVFKALDKSNK